ncbi:MAG: hypothetical protein JSS02_22710 [Planctomycetes bacterium]|nr:hypothetical protein [Planctomycetota bacterium]
MPASRPKIDILVWLITGFCWLLAFGPACGLILYRAPILAFPLAAAGIWKLVGDLNRRDDPRLQAVPPDSPGPGEKCRNGKDSGQTP